MKRNKIINFFGDPICPKCGNSNNLSSSWEAEFNRKGNFYQDHFYTCNSCGHEWALCYKSVLIGYVNCSDEKEMEKISK